MITSTITDLNIEHRQGMEPVGPPEDSGGITENQSLKSSEAACFFVLISSETGSNGAILDKPKRYIDK